MWCAFNRSLVEERITERRIEAKVRIHRRKGTNATCDRILRPHDERGNVKDWNEMCRDEVALAVITFFAVTSSSNEHSICDQCSARYRLLSDWNSAPQSFQNRDESSRDERNLSLVFVVMDKLARTSAETTAAFWISFGNWCATAL
jgi:ABC-type sulfate transport system substrate-binding protein